MYIKKKDILQKGITDVLQHASHIETCYQKKKNTAWKHNKNIG